MIEDVNEAYAFDCDVTTSLRPWLLSNVWVFVIPWIYRRAFIYLADVSQANVKPGMSNPCRRVGPNTGWCYIGVKSSLHSSVTGYKPSCAIGSSSNKPGNKHGELLERHDVHTSSVQLVLTERCYNEACDFSTSVTVSVWIAARSLIASSKEGPNLGMSPKKSAVCADLSPEDYWYSMHSIYKPTVGLPILLVSVNLLSRSHKYVQ